MNRTEIAAIYKCSPRERGWTDGVGRDDAVLGVSPPASGDEPKY